MKRPVEPNLALHCVSYTTRFHVHATLREVSDDRGMSENLVVSAIRSGKPVRTKKLKEWKMSPLLGGFVALQFLLGCLLVLEC
jgi:hypothetical protein